MKAIKTSYLILFFCIGLFPSVSLGQVVFEAVCNASEVLVGNPFEVSFQLKNAKVKKLDPPSFNGLQAQGPSVGQSFSYVNGKSSTNESYSYYVVANKPGTYKIGAAKVITNTGQTLRSKPITVKVVEKKSTANSEIAEKVFLRTELSNTDAVVGEQITVDIRIYTQVGIEQTELIKEPSFENMFSHYLRSFADKPEIVVVDGEQYYTQILRRIVVFPSKPGTIVVEPAIVEVGIANNNGRSIFNPFRLISHTLKSLPVELNVKELGGAASGFSGAVGAYTMQAHIAKNNISSDEVVELTLQVRGKGDIKQVLVPNLGINKKYFDQFPPTVNEDIREGGGLLGGIKEFHYVLTPKAAGALTIQPKFVFFDPETKQFITIDTTLQVQVTQGKNQLPSKAERDAAKKEVFVVDEPKEDLMSFKAPLAEATFSPQRTSFFLGSVIFWILTFLPFLGLLGLFKWKEKQNNLNNLPIAEQRRNNASSEASIRLQSAKQALMQENSKDFFNEISKALLGFISDKYNIPTVELTKSNVRQKLIKQEMSVEKIDSLVSILQTCEMALFAGLTNTESMEKVYHESEALIQLMS
ncbi:BatD family protein [Aureispira anguillae]|uniref:BatD family protein n=1 Tax=Aureispira anguillae TaxID=2864201 RepID=A0A915YJW5_9BACT|nr:BatD family protein [Aureispira anguillae]BDS14281.1 BatD family protein [Aureispira anguillae]